MKRKFTKLMAALALLVFTMPSLVAWGQTRNEVTYDFSQIPGFSDWTTSYTEHVVEYDDATVTFASANKQTSTITDIPVTKGQPVSLVLNDLTKNITSATFVCRQWGSKAQTITLHYSTDGGQSYTSTGTTSSNFTISSNSLPDGTNAVRITFSSTSNQVGIESATINIATSSATATSVSISVPDGFITDVHEQTTNAGTLTATVSANNQPISGATVTWSSSNENVATIDENGVVTLVAAGNTTITASYAGQTGVYAASSDTYDLEVSDSTPFAGGDVTFVAGTDMGSTTTNADGDEMIKSVVTVSSTIAAFATPEYRLYQNSSTTISTTYGEITQIAFTKTGSYPLSNLSTTTGSYDNQTGIWTGSAQSVAFSASAQVRLSQIVVTVAAPATVATPTFNPEGGVFLVPQSIEIGCETNGVSIYYTTDGSDPDANSMLYNGAISVSTTTTLKAIAIKNGESSYIGEATYTFPETVTIADARALNNNEYALVQGVVTFIDGRNVYVQDATAGICLYLNSETVPSDLTIGDMVKAYGKKTVYHGLVELGSIDGSDANMFVISSTGNELPLAVKTTAEILEGAAGDLQSTRVKIEGAEIGEINTSGNTPLTQGSSTVNLYKIPALAETIEEGDNVDVIGVIGYYDAAQIRVASADDVVEVQVQHNEYTLTVGNPDHVTFTVTYDEEVLENGETAEVLDGTEVTFTVNVENGYVLESVTVVDENQQAVSFTVNDGVYSFNMPAYDVTINATATEYVAPTGDEYELYTGALTEGDYLIVYDGAAMNNVVNSDRLQYEEVTVSNGSIITDEATIIWHIAPSGEYWTIYSADANAFAASTGAKNKAQMLADGTDDKALWTVSGTETYEFVNKQNTTNNVNANLRKNGTYGFACYATSTGGALSLYKKVESTPVTETYTLTINGYTDDNSKTGYYLIASPVTVDPANVEGMTEGTFDLYCFNQAENDEWRNYEANQFNLEPGKGYLYAKKKGDSNDPYVFTLTGVPYDGDGEIELTNTTGAQCEGWNLVGNPFGVEAEISMDYYELNPTETELIAGTDAFIDAMQGVFVKYTEDDQTVIFDPGTEVVTPSHSNDANVVLNVTRNRGNVIDRAIVRFGEGQQLPKFQLNPNNTKVYIPEGNQDFAIVRSAAEAEMPVSFKASENGTYTLAIETENVEMNYLHLIDNMTGMDVDLLQTPSYTFEAKTNDYTSRFRLVFKASSTSSEADETFAYYNGSSWTVSNLGEATLQVVDVTGRTLSSETINGNATINLNQTPGVYMLRLVNGNSVKVQKVVVR